MQAPLLSYEEFIVYLKEHGWELVPDQAYWEKFDRVILRKEKVTFPIQLRDNYGFPIVVKICQSIGIPAPPDHQRNYDQLHALRLREMLAKAKGVSDDPKNRE